MRLIDATVGEVLERPGTGDRVEIVGVELSRHPNERNFVTYCRVGDPNRVFTATATHDDASEPEHRAARDWLRA